MNKRNYSSLFEFWRTETHTLLIVHTHTVSLFFDFVKWLRLNNQRFIVKAERVDKPNRTAAAETIINQDTLPQILEMNQFLRIPSSPSSSPSTNDWKNELVLSPMFHRKQPCLDGGLLWSSRYYNAMLQQSHTTLCEGNAGLARPPGDNHEPPCSTCKYTGMAVCTGMSLYFLKLANELESAPQSMAKQAATKNHKPFFYGGAVFWACAGIYRSMLD